MPVVAEGNVDCVVSTVIVTSVRALAGTSATVIVVVDAPGSRERLLREPAVATPLTSRVNAGADAPLTDESVW